MRALLLPLLACLLAARGVAAPPPRFTPEEERALSRGEVVTRFWKVGPENAGAGWAAGVVAASPERVFAVIADVGRYKDFLDRVTASSIIRRAGDTYDFFYRIKMPWPLSDHWCVTHNRHEVDARRREFRRIWWLDRGTFVRNDGSWLVRPSGSSSALLIYSVVLKPKVSAPDFVLDYVTRVALPRSVKSMRARVLDLERGAPPTR